jgi:hypothetical protein
MMSSSRLSINRSNVRTVCSLLCNCCSGMTCESYLVVVCIAGDGSVVSSNLSCGICAAGALADFQPLVMPSVLLSLPKITGSPSRRGLL